MRKPDAQAGTAGAEIKTSKPIGNTAPIHVAKRHLSAARMLRIALTLGTARFTEEGRLAVWLNFARVLTLRLTDRERALIAYWLLRTLSADVRRDVFEGAHWRLHDEG